MVKCVASFRSSNGRISFHFDNIRLNLSTHIYVLVLAHSMLSNLKNSRSRFYDVITNEIYL